MLTLRTNLSQIGISPMNTVRFPRDFHSMPRSLRLAVHAMQSPRVDEWMQLGDFEPDTEMWTEECQCMITDGEYWYASSNNDDFRGVYKLSFDFHEIAKVELPPELGNHPGAMDIYDGRLYVPVEGDRPRLWVLDLDLNPLEQCTLFGREGGEPPQDHMPWCAFNPWNGYLYSSEFASVTELYAYDPHNNYQFTGLVLPLDGGQVTSVQGGCFTRNGHFYLVSSSMEELRVYSMLNGKFLGSRRLETEGTAEEPESVFVYPVSGGDGQTGFVHAVILDNDWISKDDVRIIRFAVPDPSVL